MYDPESNTGGIFTEYINTFLKIKQEASGHPTTCMDEESREAYIADYKRVEGIELDPGKIVYNPAFKMFMILIKLFIILILKCQVL